MTFDLLQTQRKVRSGGTTPEIDAMDDLGQKSRF